MTKLRPWVSQVEPPEVPEGWMTGPPDFVGVGAQRCGTSWWYDSLRKHPRVEGGSPGKELHYFDWYLDGEMNPGWIERYHELFPRPEGAICGEWTPRYMADLWPVRLLREAAPDTKVMIMLRDPVERFRSAAARERSLGDSSMRNRLSMLSDAAWRGFYYEQIARVYEFFGADRILVLQFEKAIAEPVEQMELTCRFLGIEPPSEPPERLTTHRKPSHLKRETPDWYRADLASRYRADAERLVELCPQIDLSLWKSLSDPPAAGAITISEPIASDNGAGPGTEPATLPAELRGAAGVSKWIDAHPDPWEAVRSRFRHSIQRYGRKRSKLIAATLRLVGDAADAAPVRRVADIGSVPGFVSAILADTGFEVDAIDGEVERIEPVYSAFGIASHRADVELQRLPFEDETFDLVIVQATLEHLRTDPLRPVRETARTLRPGGRAIIAVPHVGALTRLRFLLGDDSIFGDPLAERPRVRAAAETPGSRHYSAAMIREMLKRAGLREERTRVAAGIRFHLAVKPESG